MRRVGLQSAARAPATAALAVSAFTACLSMGYSNPLLVPVQGDDVDPSEYSDEKFKDMVTNGMLLPEIMPFVKKIVFPFTDLPESMRLQAYEVFQSTRFHYPCALDGVMRRVVAKPSGPRAHALSARDRAAGGDHPPLRSSPRV